MAMKGDSQLEPILNGILKELLYAKDCYRLERAVFKNRGYGKFASCIDDIKEVHDWAARKLIKRLLFLELTVNVDHEFPTQTDDVNQFLVNCTRFETSLLEMMAESVASTRTIPDVETHELLEKIAEKIDGNVKWFEVESKRFSDLGQALYLSEVI
jgi:bacterioferritin (cytochrome b1)